MITASHNPAKYNGYKVYGHDGCQITNVMASNILTEIENIDIFSDVFQSNFEEELSKGNISYISDDVYTAYTENVKKESLIPETSFIDKNIGIVYTPLNGTGLKPVLRALNESGYKNITIVEEQEKPDGNFPTCPYPNPEIPETLELGVKYAKKVNADILLATDPDCDRVGIAVKDTECYTLLTGNEVGVLLLDYICSQRIQNKTMPQNPIAVKTIVTTDMAEKVSAFLKTLSFELPHEISFLENGGLSVYFYVANGENDPIFGEKYESVTVVAQDEKITGLTIGNNTIDLK
jgi:phosphoglucomutase